MKDNKKPRLIPKVTMKRLDNDESTRNNTRITSLNGVWSLEFILTTDVGDAYAKVWYVLNIMCDPTVQNECFLDDCDMLDNGV